MKKLAILIWMYHNDLAGEFFDLLYPLQDLVDIHLSFCQDNDNLKSLSQFNNLSNIKSITYYPNIGADLYSFINDLSLIQNEYFIKLHTKKSNWGNNGRCNWRSMLLDSLIANKNTIQNNIKYIAEQNLGSLGCGSLIYQKTESIHKDKIRQILQICNLHTNAYRFVGGNMFIGDSALYQQHIIPYKKELCELLSLEKGKVDEYRGGTYCHSMERVLGYIGCLKGLEFCPLDTIKIKLQNNDIINLRIMYNNELYCLEQPNIYGKVIDFNNNVFTISWYSNKEKSISKYIQIDHNLYINQLYLHSGV